MIFKERGKKNPCIRKKRNHNEAEYKLINALRVRKCDKSTSVGRVIFDACHRLIIEYMNSIAYGYHARL